MKKNKVLQLLYQLASPLAVMVLGLVLIFSALTVYFRDLSHILGIVTMAWQFLTPVMYDVSMVPENLRPIFNLTPMTPVILAYRDILYYQRKPDLSTLVTAAALGVVFLALGAVIFRRMQKGFAEEL